MNERSDMTEAMMDKDDDGGSLDRRMFLGASTATLLGLPGISLAQQQKPGGLARVATRPPGHRARPLPISLLASISRTHHPS
jgi:hypothetical protein